MQPEPQPDPNSNNAGSNPNPGDITRMLHHLGTGGVKVSNDSIEQLYRELKQLAFLQLRGERGNHTLQATALVNEAYMRLIGHGEWADRNHFFRVAARVMRQILVDYARARRAQKRGGDELIIQLGNDSPAVTAPSGRSPEEVIALDECLTELALESPRQAQIVELRFFGGLSQEEVCKVLNIAPRTARRDWIYARSLLYKRLKRIIKPEDPDQRNNK